VTRVKTIGILGAGQLARMMALAGLPFGYRFCIYDTSGSPSAGIGTIFSDPDNTQTELDDFLSRVDVVTYEFEHLPLDLAQRITASKPLHPNVPSLATCQDRELEKALFTQLGIPVPAYHIAHSAAELHTSVTALGMPVVAKSTTQGYDGKGQAVIRSLDDVDSAWHTIGHDRLIVEAFVHFRRELSVIAVRSPAGQVVVYPLVENHHHEGILRYTLAPAPALSATLDALAEVYITRLLNHLDYVGVMALELFETAEGGLLANEMAPRVHNSGHWSMNGAATSQFENHLRAISGLPLGSTACVKPTCMINLVGCDIDLAAVAGCTDCHIHLYDKLPRPGRKVGHINVCADTPAALHARVEAVLALLPSMPPYPYTAAC
jgi:5-(carboxyamino)imidazole ribonucleotide synthase